MYLHVMNYVLQCKFLYVITEVGISNIANKGTYILWRRNINYVNRESEKKNLRVRLQRN